MLQRRTTFAVLLAGLLATHLAPVELQAQPLSRPDVIRTPIAHPVVCGTMMYATCGENPDCYRAFATDDPRLQIRLMPGHDLGLMTEQLQYALTLLPVLELVSPSDIDSALAMDGVDYVVGTDQGTGSEIRLTLIDPARGGLEVIWSTATAGPSAYPAIDMANALWEHLTGTTTVLGQSILIEQPGDDGAAQRAWQITLGRPDWTELADPASVTAGPSHAGAWDPEDDATSWSWSPDGQHLLYVSERSGRPMLYLEYDVHLIRIAEVPAGARVSWLPVDGS